MDNSWIDTEDYIYDSWKDRQVMKSYESSEYNTVYSDGDFKSEVYV